MAEKNTLESIYRTFDSIQPDENGCYRYPGTRWKHPTSDYYFIMKLGGKQYKAHRLALERKLGRPIRPGFNALHHCDCKSCVNPDHLYEGTDKDNQRDRVLRNPESFAYARSQLQIEHNSKPRTAKQLAHFEAVRVKGSKMGLEAIRQKRGWQRALAEWQVFKNSEVGHE
jgi:hypothetical protein